MIKKYIKFLPIAVAIVILVIFSNPNIFSLIAGGVLVLIGEMVRIWAGGHLIRNNEVTTSGPYSYLRDPLYLGRFFLLIGFCLMAWGWYSLAVLVLGLIVFFLNYMPRKHKKEMARLEGFFGEEYVQYAKYARSLIPKFKPYPQARKRPWSFDLFWNENREQYFCLGAIIVSLLIILRYLKVLPF